MQNPTRRRFLKTSTIYLTTLVAASAALPLLNQTANAASSMSKESAGYQDSPKDGKQCKACYYFAPGASPTENVCRRGVTGPISEHGYCSYFSPKS